jgi:excisionase family DNA binding protein
MTVLKIAEAAGLLGVSEDTVRRWAEAGRLETTRLPSGRQGVDGRVLAEAAIRLADASDAG